MSLEQILLDIAPEMETIDGEARARFLNYAEVQTRFGAGISKDLAIANLAAHFYTMSKRNGSAGVITGEKEGDLSVNYNATQDLPYLGQTSYGREYMRLQRMYVMAARTRMG